MARSTNGCAVAIARPARPAGPLRRMTNAATTKSTIARVAIASHGTSRLGRAVFTVRVGAAADWADGALDAAASSLAVALIGSARVPPGPNAAPALASPELRAPASPSGSDRIG